MQSAKRARSLVEVAERTREDGDLHFHLRSFLDAFYGLHGDKDAQAAFIAEEPSFLDDARHDAYLGGVGEHLARRWDLPIPAWVRDERRYLDTAMFVLSDKTLRPYLMCVAPVAFRTRLIFTGPDPLQRARFPRGEAIAFPEVMEPAEEAV